jgi:hypothetical protein
MHNSESQFYRTGVIFKSFFWGATKKSLLWPTNNKKSGTSGRTAPVAAVYDRRRFPH